MPTLGASGPLGGRDPASSREPSFVGQGVTYENIDPKGIPFDVLGISDEKQDFDHLKQMTPLDIPKGGETSLLVTWDDGEGIEDTDHFSWRFRVAMWKAMIPSVQGTDLGTKIRPDCIRCYDCLLYTSPSPRDA